MDRYIDRNMYLNIRNNYKNKLLLKYRIHKNNKIIIERFINKEYITLNYKLDDKQKTSIVTDEVNTLLLAGAGTGKTLTIVGKVNYLIEKLNIKEDEILCISFTNNTVNQLKEKIKYNVDIFTFHKLAIEIISDYKYFYNISSSDYLEYMTKEIFLSICKNSNEKIIDSLVKTIINFINLYKVNDYDDEYIDKIIKKNNNKILLVIRDVMNFYYNELKSQCMYDFNDLINYASVLIKERGLKRYYKYIIIDEYQDISNTRFELIRLIKESCSSKIFAVGDDYQSIYRFAGSNIDMIVKFKKYFGYTKIIKLNNTYRNSNELLLVAKKFIMKNKYQINKKLISNKSIKKPIKIIYYKKNQVIKLKKILDNENKYLILSRNNYDINLLIDKDIVIEEDSIIYNNKKYEYKSIHKSKGLEEDNVIILNMSNDYNGFPSKKVDEVSKLLQKKERYLYEEERRLFYVALTRTRNYVYLLVDKEKPSIFIKELFSNSRKYIEVIYL